MSSTPPPKVYLDMTNAHYVYIFKTYTVMVDGCISLALPAIDLEQSQHFSDMPPLVISTGHCPEM